jgi:large subunit ribosomal protein L3
MKKFLIGTKQGMTQLFDTTGAVHPVTLIAAPANTVTQIKTTEADGYSAVQVGFGTQKEQRINRPQKKKGLFRSYKEFRMGDTSSFVVGNTIDVSVFAEGDIVQVSGLTKAKGFQGVVKRHGFKGGPRTHGQKHSEREAGSIGGGPGRAGGRVVKGLKMAGRMGADRVTTTNLKIAKIDAEKGEIYVTGAVPGRKGTVIEIVQK